MTARVDSGKTRVGLRLEGVSAKGGARSASSYRDRDGVVRTQVKTTQATGVTPAVTDGEPIDSGKPGSAGARGPTAEASMSSRSARRAAAKTPRLRPPRWGAGLLEHPRGGAHREDVHGGARARRMRWGTIFPPVKEFKIYREVLTRKESAKY
jgi:hypothetical protein